MLNKRRSRIAIFSVNVAHKRLIKHTTNHFLQKKPNIDKKHLDGDLVGKIQAGKFTKLGI